MHVQSSDILELVSRVNEINFIISALEDFASEIAKTLDKALQASDIDTFWNTFAMCSQIQEDLLRRINEMAQFATSMQSAEISSFISCYGIFEERLEKTRKDVQTESP